MKKNFLTSVAFALALGLVACGDGGSTNGPSNNHEDTNISSVEFEDDLPSCTESREGFVRFIDETKDGFICKDRKWVHYDMIADVEENLPGCTGSREGLSAYLYEEDRELNCVEGSWDVVGEVASSSSSEKSGSSSSREKDGSSSSVAPNSSSSVIPGTDPGSSSSVVSSSSSSVIPDSDRGSSSSVASSCSEESSSSATSSSSVASSSSSSVISGSSSSVIPGTDPGSSSSSAKSSSSVASSSSAKSSSSVASSSSIKYGSLIDSRDNQVYKTVTIGTQIWMAENLNYAYTGVKYNYSSYTSDSTSWCYENKASNCDKYGRLYTWSAVMDSAAQFSVNAGTRCGYGKTCTPNSPHRGICPEGWHVPTNEEYSTLYTYIGGSSTAGSLLKSTSGWSGSGNGTDKYGFSVLPAGGRDDNGNFSTEGSRAYLWSASGSNSNRAWYQYFDYDNDGANQYYDIKSRGRSLRCLKD
ncbi:MAG: fibrobacter succinogenes major paralogous domain-containing protein [Fibrobacter sp.]|nr:fibrobacter succinogenes major paralogous domain-containing protein [Fibrobacter sp.]